MTTTLRVIIDQLTGPTPGGIGRYAEDLTSAVVAATPSGCDIEMGCFGRRIPAEGYTAEDITADSFWGHRWKYPTS